MERGRTLEEAAAPLCPWNRRTSRPSPGEVEEGGTASGPLPDRGEVWASVYGFFPSRSLFGLLDHLLYREEPGRTRFVRLLRSRSEGLHPPFPDLPRAVVEALLGGGGREGGKERRPERSLHLSGSAFSGRVGLRLRGDGDGEGGLPLHPSPPPERGEVLPGQRHPPGPEVSPGFSQKPRGGFEGPVESLRTVVFPPLGSLLLRRHRDRPSATLLLGGCRRERPLGGGRRELLLPSGQQGRCPGGGSGSGEDPLPSPLGPRV
ncbi:MAG: hypothetical protein BWY86_01284 [Candidatus Aminicenantes bacterium ADurb.Bin508]|nr:MAG: hypothetical protein BWY86_01284 [Candidatus Aminicenantes bacterium ADurb.Bin508]